MRAKRSKIVTFNSMHATSESKMVSYVLRLMKSGKKRREVKKVKKVVFMIRGDTTVEDVNLILHSLLMPTELSARGFQKGQLREYGEGGEGKVSLHNWGRGFRAYKVSACLVVEQRVLFFFKQGFLVLSNLSPRQPGKLINWQELEKNLTYFCELPWRGSGKK